MNALNQLAESILVACANSDLKKAEQLLKQLRTEEYERGYREGQTRLNA